MCRERMVILLILAVSSASIAYATSDIVDMKQYKVFFDIGQHGKDYNANIFPPDYSEGSSGEKQTSYRFILENSTSGDILTVRIMAVEKAYVPFTALDSFTIDTLSLKSIMNLVPEGFAYISSDRRVIDGRLGVVIKAKNLDNRKTGYFAQYSLPGENDIIITVLSYWPWYPDTLKLLDTIHVERVK